MPTRTKAKPKQPPLPTFENHPVQQAQVRITNAGDGLSEALKIEPKALDLGAETFYVLSGVVTQINHRQKDDESPTIRVHTIRAEQITEVDPELAGKLLQTAAEELERRRAEIEGQMRLGEEQAAEERERDD